MRPIAAVALVSLLALASGRAHAQGGSVLLIVDDPVGLSAELAPTVRGVLVGRGYAVRDAGAVLAARVHLFGSADGALDDAQAIQLARTLGDRVILVAVRPVEPAQAALQVRAPDSGAAPLFVLAPRADAAARVLAELPGFLALLEAQDAPAAAPSASAALAPLSTGAPTSSAAIAGPAPSRSTALITVTQAPGTVPFVPGEAPAEDAPEAPPGDAEVEEQQGSDFGFFGHIAVQANFVYFPSVSRVDGNVTFRGLAAFAFSDDGWGIGAVAIGGTPTFDLNVDGFFTAGAGVTLDHGYLVGGASTFLNGTAYIGLGAVTTLGNWLGASGELSVYIHPDTGTLSVMLGFGIGFGNPNAN